MSKKIAVASLAIILMLVNWSIAGKERHLTDGKIVYLNTVPVDPRSLMQGDYMALRFGLAEEVYRALPKTQERRGWRQDVAASDAFVVVSLDERRIGTFKSLDTKQPLSSGDVRMRYRIRNGELKFATNAFFFQEGHGEYFENARYGQFRVDENGELLLVSLHDDNLRLLEAPKE